ncbi:non-ribosomal peptide synthase/polyketide synthase [Nocardia spumae]|uniref:non-ribosomal peptide synthase/polyketide synthase n=1 Tax=Nocardia spumae TaxID=2887190 RepID=UPI001D153449|nr:non-ribosomal peptide synthase/polyketide synthase [Nocardia spumae]
MVSSIGNSRPTGGTESVRHERLPLTAAQLGVWHSSRLLDASMTIAMYIEVVGDLDIVVLERAGRTAGLEMGSGYVRIGIQDDEPYQVVDPDAYTPVDYVDLRESADPAAEAHAWMRRDSLRHIDILRERLIRTAFLRVGDRRWFWYLAAHHIVLDGFGAMNLIQRTAHLYTAMLTGGEPQPLAAGNLRDLVDSDLAYRNSSRFETDRAYWRQRLADHREPAMPMPLGGRGAAETVNLGTELPQAVSESVRPAAERLGASESELFIAASAGYLAHLSGRGDVILSLPVAARTTAVLRRSAGMLSNIVPLRLEVGRRTTISELLRAVRLAVTGALRHQRYRYEDIRRETATAGMPFGTAAGPRINVSPVHMEIGLGAAAGQVHVLSTGGVDDLTVSFYRSAAAPRYRVDLEARAGLDADDEVRRYHDRLLEYFARFVHADAEDPVWSIPVTGDRERRRLLDLGSGLRPAGAPAADPPTLASALAVQARRTPGATAVTFEGERLSYSELASRVHRLARYLVRVGVGPESMVAVHLRRSVDLVVAVHAIAEAGGAFVPLDPDHPVDRTRYVVADTRPVCVLTSSRDRPGTAGDAGIVEIDRVDLSPYSAAPLTDADRKSPLRQSNTAYVIFTSGSTGRPKGVAVSHAAVANRMSWMPVGYELTAADTVLQKTPVSFDVSVWELFGPLRSGARLVLARPDGHRDPRYLAEVIVAEQVTVVHFVPSMLALFLAEPTVRECSSLRAVFASGEALPAAVAQRLTELTGACPHNLYGPTEAAIEVTAHRVTAQDTASVPIGLPIPGTRVYVLDSWLHPVPAGVAGELYLAGVQLARGYAGRAAATAARFVPDPFGTGERMYRTGDLVTWTAAGELEYLGRTDLQVKLRGVRIEPREIESVLTGMESIVQAAVAVHTDERLGDQLVAYVVTTAVIDTAAVRAELTAVLPPSLVPSAIVVAAALPLTASGKLDRAALPAPVFASRAFRPLSTPTQRTVADAFSAVLGAARIGSDDNFFELGGNSLVGAQVVARLTDGLGIRLAVRDLFEAPTVAALAERVEHIAAEPARPALVSRPRPAHVPLAFAQRRMWLLNQLDTTSPVDNMPVAIRLSGAVNVRALERAARDLLARHEILRTRYPETPDGPAQQTLPPEAVPIDLAPRPIDADDVAAAVADVVSGGFDVSTEIPFRLRLFHTGTTEYVLAAVVHHISADGWSLMPFTRDLMIAYSSRLRGEAPSWSPLPVQYADYSRWQRELLGSADDPDSRLARQAAFWRRTLAGLPDELSLPTDRPRPPARSLRGGRVTFRIGPELDHRLRRLAREYDVTTFMVVHSAYAVLLARLSGSTDIAVGTPIAGRGAAELDDLIGMFVNTLVLRTTVAPEETFTALLARTKAADLAAFDHADIPFEQVVDLLRPQRSPARHPLFQVALSFDNTPDSSFQLHGIRVRPLDLGVDTAKFDLALTIRENSDPGSGMAASFSYARDLFDEATVEVLGQRFLRLLSAATTEPDTPVGELPILFADEYRMLTTGPEDRALTAGPVDTGLLPDLLAHGMRLRRERIAVRDAGRAVTYGELDDDSSRLARLLIDRGVGPENVVAVALPRSYDLIVAVSAIAAAGGAYLPLDPAHPAERIAYMLTDPAAVQGITSSTYADTLPGEVEWLVLDDPATARQCAARPAGPITDADRHLPVRAAHPAYLIYTSGSTGKPKGVSVTHAGLAGLVAEVAGAMRLTAGHRFLGLSSPNFDPSLLEYLCALHTGATLVIAPRDLVGGPDLAAYLRAERVTHIATTPGVLATMEPDGLEQVTAIGIGGDVAAPELVAKWSTGRDLFNFYGPTETTILSSYTRLTAGRRVTIGRSVRGMWALVLDSRLCPVPPGVTGELYLIGAGLARGYRGSAGATAERFLAAPWGAAGARMYRTGDLVRWCAVSGELHLEFVGRSDFQVKIRGFRIELGEIDAVLGRHRRIEFAVTTGRRTPAGTTALVSYVLATGDTALDPADVIEHARRSLPRHMVPAAVVILDELPLTPVGKLDRDALPEPAVSQREFRAPVGEVERTVAEVFAAVLGLSNDVGRDDDFFELGGNSLVATHVVARLGAALDTRIPVRLVFEAPTVAALARRAEERAGRGRRAVRAGARRERIPLSPAQRRMWFLNRFDRQSAAYNMPAAVRLTGVLDVDALRLAISDLVARHEILRTVYPQTDSGPVQVILPPEQAVPALALRTAAPDRVESAVRELATTGFDVTTEVPIRLALIDIRDSGTSGPGDHVLAMVIHHISADGWSAGPLTRDLMTAYAARAAGTAPDWAPPVLQYADYSIWQRELLGDEDDPESVAAEQIAYWRRELAELPDQLDLPADHPRPAVQTYAGARVAVAVDADTHRGLVELARTEGATLFMVLHTAFAVLLARLSGTGDIAIGTPSAGRGEPELDDLIGMFVNTLVFRTRVRSGEPFTAVLARQRTADIEAFAHSDVPFERLVEVLNPPRSTARHPLFQIGFSFQNLPVTRLSLPGLQVSELVIDTGTSQFDLHLNIADRYGATGEPAGISGFLTYATDLFEPATVRLLVERFVRSLAEITARPRTPVGDLTQLGREERAGIVLARNETRHPLGPETTLAALLAAALRTHGHAVALLDPDGGHLTYAELGERVNRLARHLISLGVGPESPVGVALRRSVDLVVAVYAVTVSGGAYVPVDPDQPAERADAILRAVAPVCVLTDSNTRARLDAGRDEPAADTGTAGLRTCGPCTTGERRVVVLDELELSTVSSEPITDRERVGSVRPQNTAYVLFTSGSTGQPKGVAVPHSAVVNQLLWKAQAFGLDPSDVMVLKTTATFDLSVWEFWSAVVCGGRLVISDPESDPADLNELIVRAGVTTLHTVPSMLDVLLAGALGGIGAPSGSGGRSLRRVLAIGETLPGPMAQRFRAARPDTALFNLYGPTETAVSVTWHPVTDRDRVSVPIGRPEWNCRVYVLDSRLHPVPDGVPGELYVGGAQVARGYADRADSTAVAFVADPYVPGARMYRTGDLAVWKRDGELEFRGRGDSQVKIRGFRIELGEIETALLALPEISQAAVLVRSAERLTAYLVPAVDDIDIPGVKSALARVLPSYMVPVAFVVSAALPLTVNGKLDRKALPEPNFDVAEFRAPATLTEQLVVGVFGEVLGRHSVGADDDFFALGGNSLSATHVAARLGAALGTRIPVRSIFETPTAATLAAAVDPGPRANARPAPAAGQRPDPVPLSPAQQRMWILNRLDPHSAAYNVPVAVRLTGKLDTDALGAAVGDLITRHEVLRTVYPDTGTGPIQDILPPGRAVPEPAPYDIAAEDVAAGLAEFFAAPFDVTGDIPIRIRLYRITGGTRDSESDEHILAVVVHHIAADGSSMGPLTRDLTTAYAARTAGEAPRWAPLPMQYADFAVWQRTLLGDDDDPESLAAEQIRYWIRALDGLPDQLELPTDRPRPAVRSATGGRVPITIDAALHRALIDLARGENVTLFMVVQTAFAVLLARLSGSDDIALGTPTAGRGEAALDGVIGMFVNTLVLRTRIDASEPFSALLARQRETDIHAFAHADVPFERLVEVLDPPRSPARHPLFQVGLAFQNLPPTVLHLPDVRVSPVEADVAVAQYDLHLIVADGYDGSGAAAGIDGVVVFARDLFDDETVRVLADRFVHLLGEIVAHPAAPVGEIPLLTAPERRAIAASGTGATHEVDPTLTLAALFDRAVSAAPRRTALADLSYAELGARVNRLARHLISLGVGPESRVGVLLGRSVNLVVAVYAVSVAGGAYVPVDPDQPTERIGAILRTADPVCLLTDSATRARLDESRAAVAPDTEGDDLRTRRPRTAEQRVVVLDELDVSSLPGAPLTDRERVAPLQGTNAAYVIFTSGSTGVPKGVMVPHAAIVNQLLWKNAAFGLGPDDVMLLKTTATFDGSVWEFWSPVVCGGRLVIAAPEGHRDAEYMDELIRREGVTTVFVVPSMLDALVVTAEGRRGPSEVAASGALRRVLAAGETLPGPLAQRFRAVYPDVELFNLYGPTEAAVSITCHAVTDADRISVPIGIPEWNSRVYVLDSRLHPVPRGVVGELYLAGAQLARGYAGRSDSTAERFVADPFRRGARMYRTGDLVTCNPQGQLEFRGRGDLQVKVRGVRIELGEIEAGLLAVPGVAQAAVLVRSGDPRGDLLVAYLVPTGNHLEVGAVKSALSERIPSYMIPTAFVVLDALPLNANGKLDRKAVPEPVFGTAEYRAPTGPVEQIVAGAFTELLGAEQIGADADFFDLGGNSLLATRLAARVGATLDSRIPVRTVFEAPTVAGFAARITSNAGSGGLPDLTPGPRPERLPLSPAQRRMWIVNQLDTGSAAYNIPVALRLTGDLDVAALQSAVADVIARHETLRTVYPKRDDTPYQLILPALDVVVDLTPKPVCSGEVHDRIHDLISGGFDVTAEVPLRMALFRIDTGEHVLVVVAHHIAADGWSSRPLTRDMMAAYAARVAGGAPVWERPAVQYADFTSWQRAVLGAEDDPRSTAATQIRYWRDALAGMPSESTFPADRPRPIVASRAGGSVPLTIDAETAQGLRDLARAHGASLFVVVHTALAVLLARLSNASDVAIGAPIAGRGIAALDDSIGMFVNTLVLRTRFDPTRTFIDALVRQRDTDMAAFSHAELPFDRVAESLDLPRQPSRSPLFQVALSFQNFPSETVELPGVRVAPVDIPASTEMFDITVVLGEDPRDGSVSGRISYSRDLFDDRTVRHVGERLLSVLRTVVADPAAVVGDIDLLLPGEGAETSCAAGLPGADPARTTVLDLVGTQIRDRPDDVAVRAGAESLTYAELSRRADALARLLISRGVGPGSVVAVGLDRSVRMPIALLAVLRAGAAYLPLDPSYPRARLEFVVADAAPACLITSAALLETMPADSTPVLLIEDMANGPAQAALPVPVRSDDLAYVIYTSGSTGVPKGVAVTHRNLAHLLSNALRYFDIGAGDVWTVFHSFAFDFAVWELWGALSTGGTAVVVDHLTSRSPDTFRDLLIREKVTVSSQTPSAFRQLDEADRRAGDPSLALRYVVFGGETLETPTLTGWFERYADDSPHLVNMYGITEATVHVTIRSLDRQATVGASVGSGIGHGLPGVGTHVLDDRLHPAPTGTPGEMYVTGPQVARGYLGRAGLTATRFVADPAGPPGARMYRCGDLVRRTTRGLEYLRRSDHQLQLRGFRIEPGEIEAVLTRCGGADAKVIARDGRLLAYLRGADPAAAADIRRAAALYLPEHMVPAAITVVDSWPMTVNGKLDLRALPDPDFAALSTARAPRTDRERALAAIVAEVLGLTEIGIDDDFFQMGGDSLSAVRLRSRIRHVLGEDIQVQDIFQQRTVAGLATVATRPLGLPARADSVRTVPVPLSYPQRRLLELNDREQSGPGPGRAYAMMLRLHGSTPPAAIAQALADLTARHEILRTVFPGQQLILDEAIDVETVVTDDIPAATAACLARPFDLRTEVPLRVRLYPDGDSDLLLIVLHHMAADGWSVAPLIHDFATALHARGGGTRPQWDPLPIQYAEHAIWQHRVTGEPQTSVVTDTQLAFWRTTLAGLPPAVGPSRSPDSAQPMAGRVLLYVEPDRYRRSVSFAAAHDASVFMVVHTAFALTLREFGYGNDIAVCAPTAGRTEVGMEDMVGRFTNFLVLRTAVDDHQDFVALLERVRDTTLAAMDHQDIPFEFLTDALGIGDRLRIRLAFQNIPTSDLRRAGLPATWEPVEAPAPADWDLSLVLSEEKDDGGHPRALYGLVEYATDAVDAPTTRRIATRFDEILSAGIESLEYATRNGPGPATRSGSSAAVRADRLN